MPTFTSKLAITPGQTISPLSNPMSTHSLHLYSAHCFWKGSTAVGYENYSRAHDSSAPPATAQLRLTADPAFRGEASLLNPESLLVMSAASCQLLSFLAVAARARLDVLEYEDQALGEMPEDTPPLRVTRILLKPRITLKSGPTEQRVRHLVEVAHRECYIANSLKTEIEVRPEIHFV